MNIHDILGETTEYDKKECLEIKRPKSWCKSVSAFANGAGGRLYFGISNDDEIVGLEDASGTAEQISEIVKTSCLQDIIFQIWHLRSLSQSISRGQEILLRTLIMSHLELWMRMAG